MNRHEYKRKKERKKEMKTGHVNKNWVIQRKEKEKNK